MTIDVPDFSLIVMIGATGSGKSTFAQKHFLATEIAASDTARALVSDDENNQDVTADAFGLVREIAARRLKHRKLTVIDATNVRAPERKGWVELAREYHALPVAIVIDPGLDVCVARNRGRPDRNFGPGVPQRMIEEIRRGLKGLQREGFRRVHHLRSVDEIDAANVVRTPLWTDRRGDSGPFDIIGDVHGCAGELETLLAKLGYGVTWYDDADGRGASIMAPHGRKLVFAGDLVDRGPRSPDVLRLVMAAIAAGGYAVQGNHDNKLQRWMEGRKVTVSHGLEESIAQFSTETDAFRAKAKAFLFDLRSHYWLDGGKLAVAHAGIKETMIGRGSPEVRDFALYGETTGETDSFGLPVRANWAAAYRGKTSVVYGHVPVHAAEWVNNTICIDTGCVFGGALTALRWPEKELVSVPAERMHYAPLLPPAPDASAISAQAEADRHLHVDDVIGRRWIDTPLMRRIAIAEENAAAALEVMSRHAVAPQWLIYLPPTMSPVETSKRDHWLERPEEAFAFYRERHQTHVAVEEKHMGSRANIVLCRTDDVAIQRFGLSERAAGMIYTRTGRAFFDDPALQLGVLHRLRQVVESAGLWDELQTDWVLLDAEIMPWSAKASSLIRTQYAPVAASAIYGLSAARDAAERATRRGVESGALATRMAERLARAKAYAGAWQPYVWPVRGIDDIKVAPFHLLASEGAVHADKQHRWHMDIAGRLAAAAPCNVIATQWRQVDLNDPAAVDDAIAWWEVLTASGGEGMVVKPTSFIAQGAKGLIQPALKVRGQEYLRLIYGPEYDAPENLVRLRERALGPKRALALREFALGLEALSRFVARAPLRRVHECVFGVLALESERIDPRL